MAAPQVEMKEQNVQGDFSTAEITHVTKGVQLEGLCYLQNHLLMKLTGTEGVIRQYHDNVTRPNVERLTGLVGELGVPLPFAKPLEDRENDLKAKLQNVNVEGTLTEGDALGSVIMDADQLNVFYAVSIGLATHQRVIDVFRRNQQAVLDFKPKLDEAFRRTKEYVAPPLAQKVRVVGAQAKGVQARGGGRTGV